MRTIYANSEKLSIRYHTYENVRFKDFMRGLLKLRLRHRILGKIPRPPPPGTFRAKPGDVQITIRRLFQRLNDFLSDNTMVVVDVGDALFGATDLFIRRRTEFLGPAYYASMGFCGAGEHRGANGESEAAAAGVGGGRRVSDDGDGAVHERAVWAESDRDCAEQFWLRHRAAHAGRRV